METQWRDCQKSLQGACVTKWCRVGTGKRRWPREEGKRRGVSWLGVWEKRGMRKGKGTPHPIPCSGQASGTCRMETDKRVSFLHVAPGPMIGGDHQAFVEVAAQFGAVPSATGICALGVDVKLASSEPATGHLILMVTLFISISISGSLSHDQLWAGWHRNSVDALKAFLSFLVSPSRSNISWEKEGELPPLVSTIHNNVGCNWDLNRVKAFDASI